MQPFFSIITVTRNEVWSLTKTMRSVFAQSFKDIEYIVIDGGSTDQTHGLIEFWKSVNFVDKFISEKDGGVYDAMNKGIKIAEGKYVCLMNTGDTFADSNVLGRLHETLTKDNLDGVLGWGGLYDEVWASWAESQAIKMSSLGFCHQALYVKTDILKKNLFDDRKHKTDSDTLQVGRLLEKKHNIKIIPEVLAIRDSSPGISADSSKSESSIISTLQQEYPTLSKENAEQILKFRRTAVGVDAVLALMKNKTERYALDMAYMVLDTLVLKQSKKLSDEEVEKLYTTAVELIKVKDPKSLQTYFKGQSLRNAFFESNSDKKKKLDKQIYNFNNEESRRLLEVQKSASTKKISASNDCEYVVSMTSFPARISTLHFVIQSLIHQTFKPKEIHLWLGANEIPNTEWLPNALKAYQKDGLVINFVDRTMHQYDKFMHNAKLNKDFPFVIVDDDVIYKPDSMEKLILKHLEYKHAVVANRCHEMAIEPDGKLKPYEEWQREVNYAKPSYHAFPTGAGGVLYPVGYLCDPEVTDAMKILSLAPYADDIWLKFLGLANKVPACSTELSGGQNWYERYTPTMKEGALHATNVDLGLNDLQINRCKEWLTQLNPQWLEMFA